MLRQAGMGNELAERIVATARAEVEAALKARTLKVRVVFESRYAYDVQVYGAGELHLGVKYDDLEFLLPRSQPEAIAELADSLFSQLQKRAVRAHQEDELRGREWGDEDTVEYHDADYDEHDPMRYEEMERFAYGEPTPCYAVLVYDADGKCVFDDKRVAEDMMRATFTRRLTALRFLK